MATAAVLVSDNGRLPLFSTVTAQHLDVVEYVSRLDSTNRGQQPEPF
jgi:hypothetical protein